MSAPDLRAAVLRAIADAMDAGTAATMTSSTLLFFPDSLDAALTFARSLPLQWTGEPPEHSAGGNFYRLTGKAADLTVHVHIRKEDAGSEGEARTITVRDFTPDPDIAALLEPEGGEQDA